MKSIEINEADLGTCVSDAQQERVILTENGKPKAMILGIGGLDDDQLRLAGSHQFWSLIEERRKQPTISRHELEEKLDASSPPESSSSST